MLLEEPDVPLSASYNRGIPQSQFEVSVRNPILVFLLFFFLTLGCFPVQSDIVIQNPAQDPAFGRERPKDPNEEKMERDREKALNKQRQTSLQKDTDRLLQLATELKEYVDKSNEHTLSLDVIKKADEIEKLARSVKGKMKGN
jgi:hypothetical protein